MEEDGRENRQLTEAPKSQVLLLLFTKNTARRVYSLEKWNIKRTQSKN